MRAFLYDTWAFLALANAADPHHQAAVEADRRLEALGYAAVTTEYVVDETLTGLNVAAGARVALRFADLLGARVLGEDVLLLEIDAARRERAMTLFRRIASEERRLSFTDCTSFAAMHELGLEIAFTADRHFVRAGRSVRPLFERRAGGLVARLPSD